MSGLYYRVGSAVWGVEISTKPSFGLVGSPRQLFDGPYTGDYDIHPLGEAFAMTKLGVWEGQIVLLQNLFAELKRLVPSD